ncbi:MAG: hypothetical protein LBV61_07735 [Burkholderiaceae bacterium]|jgi:hypothetical protein|nr:hypothetical protein [Burkholderiaceae bacterium]
MSENLSQGKLPANPGNNTPSQSSGSKRKSGSLWGGFGLFWGVLLLTLLVGVLLPAALGGYRMFVGWGGLLTGAPMPIIEGGYRMFVGLGGMHWNLPFPPAQKALPLLIGGNFLQPEVLSSVVLDLPLSGLFWGITTGWIFLPLAICCWLAIWGRTRTALGMVLGYASVATLGLLVFAIGVGFFSLYIHGIDLSLFS